MTHPLHALYTAVTGDRVEPGPLTCWFCGCACEDGEPVRQVVRSTFNDMARARAGDDGPVCAACVHYLDFKILRPGGKRGMGLFTKTVIVEAGESPMWREWEREEMLPEVLRIEERGTARDTYYTCNYSKQKHVLPWAKLTPAGERYPWISTDQGDIRLTPEWPGLAWCIAWLWGRGYPKTLLTSGSLGAYQLSQSDEPAVDLAAAGALGRLGADPMLDYLSYIVTEDNRDRVRDTLAGRAGPLLRGADAVAASRRAAGGDHQCGSGPRVQESVPAAMVGHRRGEGAARRDDLGQPHAVEQLGLW